MLGGHVMFRVCALYGGTPYNEPPMDRQNLLAVTRFLYIEVLFHRFCCYWSQENHSLYRGLRYAGVRYIEGFWDIIFFKTFFQRVAFDKS